MGCDKNDGLIAVRSTFRHSHRFDGDLAARKIVPQQILHVGAFEVRAGKDPAADEVAACPAQSGNQERAARPNQFQDPLHAALPVVETIRRRIHAVCAQHGSIAALRAAQRSLVAHVDVQQRRDSGARERLTSKHIWA